MLPILIGIAAIVVTVMLHASLTSLVVGGVMRRLAQSVGTNNVRRSGLVAGAAALLALKHYGDILLWALAYRHFGGDQPLEDLGTAIYFSSVTYTTLGYGDIVLPGDWRVICGIEAMNGTLLFGWSTALLFLLVQRLYFPPGLNASPDS